MSADAAAQEMSCGMARWNDDVKKLASEARTTMIAPAGQRINNHRLESQVQAEKLPFLLHAVVVITTTTTIAPAITDDDLSRHIFNDHVRGAVERDTLALSSASMTMAEIFRRATTSTTSSIHHHHHQEAVFELQKNVQLELKQFGRPIVYVKPLSVDVSLNEDFSDEEAAEDDGASVRQACKVEEEVARLSKMGQIMGWALKSLKPQILQVVYGNDDTTDGQLKQQIKLLSTYSLKALWFAMPMFYASLTHHYSTSTALGVGDTLFLVAIITDAALILLLPKWGNALVCISCLLLELATCLLILSFNQYYAFAILTALLLLLLVALLQPKLRHVADRHVLPSFTQDMIRDDGEESPYVGHLLDLSQGIASFGGLFTAIAGSFMVGPVNAVGFFFFCAIALGLYLSMVVTVGAVTRPHAKCLAIVVMVLVVLTFIAACIPFVGHSRSKPKPQVAT